MTFGYTEIEVPLINDTISRVVLSGKSYKIRFTYMDYNDHWTFSLLDSNGEILVQGVKIVPNYSLTFFCPRSKLPDGFFFCRTKNERIGRFDFALGDAMFVYVSNDSIVEDD